MTMALCFNCGETKFGAICPCPKCKRASTGNMNLDISFSDHNLSVPTLAAFGEVVRAIRRVCDDEQLRFWSFIRYVSVHHSDILTVDQPEEARLRCDALLAEARPPPVVVQRSRERIRPTKSALGTKRRWWRFWSA